MNDDDVLNCQQSWSLEKSRGDTDGEQLYEGEGLNGWLDDK